VPSQHWVPHCAFLPKHFLLVVPNLLSPLKHCSAAAYGVLPCSILFLAIFNVLSVKLSRKRLFNGIISAFMLYMFVFSFLMFPNAAALHPHAAAEVWLQVLPPGFAGGVAVVRNWSYSIFYCFSEMWGDVGLSLLFWSLANETTSISDAAVLYPLFGIGANVAQVFAGQCLKSIGASGSVAGGFVPQMQGLATVIIAFGGSILLLHNYICRSATFRTDMLDREESVATGSAEEASSAEGGCSAGCSVGDQQERGGSAFVARTTKGAGIMMQVVDDKCVSVYAMGATPSTDSDVAGRSSNVTAAARVLPAGARMGQGEEGGLGAYPRGSATERGTHESLAGHERQGAPHPGYVSSSLSGAGTSRVGKTSSGVEALPVLVASGEPAKGEVAQKPGTSFIDALRYVGYQRSGQLVLACGPHVDYMLQGQQNDLA
jgi:hypothetical protein